MAKKKITEVTEELIRDFLDERKLSLWACEFVKEGPDYFLRVYIDKEEGYVGTQECEEVSRFLSDKLDEQDLIEREYTLRLARQEWTGSLLLRSILTDISAVK